MLVVVGIAECLIGVYYLRYARTRWPEIQERYREKADTWADRGTLGRLMSSYYAWQGSGSMLADRLKYSGHASIVVGILTIGYALVSSLAK